MKSFLLVSVFLCTIFVIYKTICLIKEEGMEMEYIMMSIFMIFLFCTCYIKINMVYCEYDINPSRAKIVSDISKQISCDTKDIAIGAINNENKILNIQIDSNTKVIKDNKKIIYYEEKIPIKPKTIPKILWDTETINIATEIHY